MEKIIVLALATGQKRFSASLCKLVEKYAEILASQGLLTTVIKYLKLLGSEGLLTELVILKDRIALSTEPGKLFIGFLSDHFNRLSCGRNGSFSEGFSLGLVAGGLFDGNIDIWNPLTLIRSEENESSLVGHLVRGLEFNTIALNLLVSGAEDGEICIWDLAKSFRAYTFSTIKG
ncbi:unnamed protein product [Trifolium pratense]|uniref:Uncharacterized protein n=1 Tax=Trifolium pratense TaxID=57577 RepID=A0ACB0JNM0_TRIPR|nr:unnamed protein product [Trifolium pratense]